MPCVICDKVEKGAEEEREYICSHCTATSMGLDKDQLRRAIDKLYLKDRTDAAAFLEKAMTGWVSTGHKSQQTLKARKSGIKGFKPRFLQGFRP